MTGQPIFFSITSFLQAILSFWQHEVILLHFRIYIERKIDDRKQVGIIFIYINFRIYIERQMIEKVYMYKQIDVKFIYHLMSPVSHSPGKDWDGIKPLHIYSRGKGRESLPQCHLPTVPMEFPELQPQSLNSHILRCLLLNP